MRKWTKTAGLLFLAAASVYSYRVIEAAAGSKESPQAVAIAAEVAASPVSDTLVGAPAEGNTDVKLLEDTTDPFASGSTTQPSAADGAAASTQPAADSTAAATQPSEGRSVSSSEVSVSDAGTVEIHVNDANLVEVLRMLSLQSQKNIVCSKEVRGTVTANLYNVTIREALEQVLHMNGYAYREKGNFINVYTVKELQAIEDAERKTTTETAQERKPEGRGGIDWLGIQYQDLTSALRSTHNIPESTAGVVVTNVAPTSPLYEQAVRPGSIITEVNGQPVKDVADFEKAVKGAKPKSYLRLYVLAFGGRGDRPQPFFADVQAP